MSEEWKKYYEDLDRHEQYMASIKPKAPERKLFYFEEGFDQEMKSYLERLAEWQLRYHCDAPNKPGYYRANND